MSDETNPTAYLHTLDNTEGIEENTPLLLLRFSPENPFGKPGINYSEEYPWTVDPLYTSDEITRLRADLAAVTEERDRMIEALEPFASPPLYVLARPLKYVPAPMPEDWIGGGWFSTEDFRRARAAYRGVTERASPWRDIESAPKNGDLLLGCSMFKDEYGNSCYYWIADGYFDTGGIWFFSNSKWGEYAYDEITHWMPLPEPPK